MRRSGSITGRVRITARVRGVPLPGNAYQPRTVNRRDAVSTPEIKHVVVYVKDAVYPGALQSTRAVIRQEHTKVSGEFTYDRLGTRGEPQSARAWFVQGMHTLSPRWFAAGRVEGVSAPPLISGIVIGKRTTFGTAEATVGYRLSTDFALRASFMNRKAYTRTSWDQQFGASLVWAHRWW